jgi:predicted GNAT family N-acyltransferase
MRATPVDAEAVRPLRSEVLRSGQTPAELVYPGDETAGTLHLAIRADGSIVGVASVMEDAHPRSPEPGDWRIRGMATRAQLRGRGIGATLLWRCQSHVRVQGGARIWCNARVAARTFYERDGFEVEGEVFEIAGIGAHYLMSKQLQDVVT